MKLRELNIDKLKNTKPHQMRKRKALGFLAIGVAFADVNNACDNFRSDLVFPIDVMKSIHDGSVSRKGKRIRCNGVIGQDVNLSEPIDALGTRRNSRLELQINIYLAFAYGTVGFEDEITV